MCTVDNNVNWLKAFFPIREHEYEMCVSHESTNFINIEQNRGTFIKVVVFISTHFVIFLRKNWGKKN